MALVGNAWAGQGWDDLQSPFPLLTWVLICRGTVWVRIHVCTSASSFFCPSVNQGCCFCMTASFSRSCFRTSSLILQGRDTCEHSSTTRSKAGTDFVRVSSPQSMAEAQTASAVERGLYFVPYLLCKAAFNTGLTVRGLFAAGFVGSFWLVGVGLFLFCFMALYGAFFNVESNYKLYIR